MLRKFFDPNSGSEGGDLATKVDFSSFKPVENGNGGDIESGNSESEPDDQSAEDNKPAGSEDGKKPIEEKPETNQSSSESGDNGNAGTKPLDWAEAIKGIEVKDILAKLGNRNDILKALGMSDFVINLNDHYDRTGNANDYIKVMDVDYSKLTDDQVIMAGIRHEKPNASESVIQKLYQKELEKYDTDATVHDAETVELGNFLKKEKADEYRNKLVEEQKKFAIPQKDPAHIAAEAAKKAEDEAKSQAQLKENEAFTKSVIEDPISKNLISNKLIKIGGQGKDGYNFEVKEPQRLVDMATGKENFFALFGKSDGTVDLDLFYSTVAFAMNRTAFENSLISKGKSMANKEHIDDDDAIHNHEESGRIETLSGWAALAKNGRDVRNDY